MGRWLRTHVPEVLLSCALLVGVGMMLYPSVSDWWNSMHQSRAIATYQEAVGDNSAEANQRLWDEAVAYNRSLPHDGGRFTLSDEERARYEQTLDVTGTGIMGYVEIPKISVSLPVYHGTDPTGLQIAVGHIPGSSLPVGGEGTHCVISGHRGLPSARLFTDIDQLREGDVFMLHVLDKTLTYQVDQIRVVLPDELDDLAMDDGLDLCTLVTCTPYGINTHRLLVRGHRIPNQGAAIADGDAVQASPALVAAVLTALVLVVALVVRTVRRRLSGGSGGGSGGTRHRGALRRRAPKAVSVTREGAQS